MAHPANFSTTGPSVGVQLGPAEPRYGEIHTVTLTGGSAATTLTLYDSLTATGRVLAQLAAPIGDTVVVDYKGLLSFGTGIFAVLTGVGSYLSVVWE